MVDVSVVDDVLGTLIGWVGLPWVEWSVSPIYIYVGRSYIQIYLGILTGLLQRYLEVGNGE